MNNILHQKKNTFTFFDDILVVTKGPKKEHMGKVLDETGTQLKIKKCQIAQKNTELLAYRLSAVGIKPIEGKVQAITDKLRSKNLKHSRSFMEAINQMNRFIANSANLCAPLIPLLKKDNELKRENKNEPAFLKTNQVMKEITEIKHFKRDLPLAIICDASKQGPGTVLQQQRRVGNNQLCL